MAGGMDGRMACWSENLIVISQLLCYTSIIKLQNSPSFCFHNDLMMSPCLEFVFTLLPKLSMCSKNTTPKIMAKNKVNGKVFNFKTLKKNHFTPVCFYYRCCCFCSCCCWMLIKARKGKLPLPVFPMLSLCVVMCGSCRPPLRVPLSVRRLHREMSFFLLFL